MDPGREAARKARTRIAMREARRAAIVEVFEEIARMPFAPHPSLGVIEYGKLLQLRERLLKEVAE
jgi:hypothetical protein